MEDEPIDQLRQSAEYLDLLLNFSTDGIMIADREGKPRIFSRSYAEVMKQALGIDMKPGIQPHKLLSDPAAVAFWDGLHRRVLSGETFTAEYSHRFSDGEVRHFSVSFHPIVVDGRVSGFSELTRETTRRRRSEEALRSSEALFRTVLESIPFELFVIGPDGRYTIQNTISRELWGSIVGKRPAEVAGDAETLATWEDNNARAFSGETVTGEVSYSIGGQLRHFHNVISPILRGRDVQGILGVNVDITDRKRAEHELQRRERLDSLGLLAGGIAHDFNNLLSGIFGHLELARCHPDTPAGIAGQLDDALSCFTRARDLTRQLLTFAKGGASVKRVVNLRPLLEDAARLSLSGSAIQIDMSLPPDELLVEADAGQLSQVFNNILINARQAMPAGGVIRIVLAPEAGHEGPEPAPGAWARIVVEDRGTGIAPDVLPKVFDPFFTTKREGSGLGLAMTYSIIRRHGGDISIDSSPERGTVVTVRLPLTDRPEPEPRRVPAGLKTRSGRALVMDDDPSVRKVLGLMLRQLGYEVDQAADGEEAVAVYRNALDSDRRHDFAILDLTVAGGLGGEEALYRIAALDPEVRGIASSGYSVGSVFTDPARHGFAAAVAKPFRLEDLGRAISEALET